MLGFKPFKFIRQMGGMNNHLYKIVGEDNRTLLLKIYVNDGHSRLERESRACKYLTKKLFPVPKVIFIDSKRYFGIFSFIKGRPKKAENVNKNDISVMVDFITNLESCRPRYKSFLKTTTPYLSLSDYVNYLDERLKSLRVSLEAGDYDNQARTFIEDVSLVEYLEARRDKLTQDINKSKCSKKLEVNKLVLSPLDFGPHNMLFNKKGEATFIDLEKFGWDDPTHVIVSFINHIQTSKMSLENKKLFLRLYFEKSNYSKSVFERLTKIYQIDELGWIAFLACTMVTEKLQHYLDTQPHISKDNYINGQIREIKKRLEDKQDLSSLM